MQRSLKTIRLLNFLTKISCFFHPSFSPNQKFQNLIWILFFLLYSFKSLTLITFFLKQIIYGIYQGLIQFNILDVTNNVMYRLWRYMHDRVCNEGKEWIEFSTSFPNQTLRMRTAFYVLAYLEENTQRIFKMGDMLWRGEDERG